MWARRGWTESGTCVVRRKKGVKGLPAKTGKEMLGIAGSLWGQKQCKVKTEGEQKKTEKKREKDEAHVWGIQLKEQRPATKEFSRGGDKKEM